MRNCSAFTDEFMTDVRHWRFLVATVVLSYWAGSDYEAQALVLLHQPRSSNFRIYSVFNVKITRLGLRNGSFRRCSLLGFWNKHWESFEPLPALRPRYAGPHQNHSVF